jgi:hypothetical protein
MTQSWRRLADFQNHFWRRFIVSACGMDPTLYSVDSLRINCKGPFSEIKTAQLIKRWAVFHFNHVQLTAGTDQMTPTSDPCLQRLLRRCR